MRLVSTSILKADMVLARSIYHRECLVLRAGQKDLTRYVVSLKRMGIEYVYVEDDKSEGIEIPDVISEETRIRCKKVLRIAMESLASTSVAELEQLDDVIITILDEILHNKDVQVSLNDISAADDYTLSHSVNTTVYSLMLASKLNYSRGRMKKLAIGTLLHDIGKLSLDDEIIFGKEQLSEEEFAHVKQHARLGYEMLKRCRSISELSRIVALQHHERMDGSGYPLRMQGDEIHEFARIVAIADVYDALTTDRCYRKKWTNERAVNYLVEGAGTKFDTKLVTLFIKQIAIYPNGSIVKLSNGSYAIVKEQNPSMPLRPIVRVVADHTGVEIRMYEIDLLKELSITIVESEVELNDR